LIQPFVLLQGWWKTILRSYLEGTSHLETFLTFTGSTLQRVMQQNSQLQVAPLSSEPFAHPAGERSYDTDPEPHTVSAQLAIF